MPARLRTVLQDFYGSHLLDLLTMAAGYALFGHVVAIVKPTTFVAATHWR